MAVYYLVLLALVIFMAICMWKIFAKTGRPGWAALVPIYSDIVSVEIIGRPGWWFLMYWIPFFGLYVAVLDKIILAKSFGKDSGFAVGLILLPVVFYPMLAFGKNVQYQGPMANGTSLSI